MNLVKVTVFAAIALSLTGCAGTQSFTVKDPASWAAGACTESQPGVTLSIEYKGKVVTHCAINYRGNGWELFNAAGFKVQGTAKYPTAFACQINGEPADTKCDDSAASGAYWGYYVAVDGVWGYATTGASDHKANCGESEGWVYMETEKTVSHLPPATNYVCK